MCCVLLPTYQALYDTLVASFGGLNAAAVSLGLSKKNLVEEAEQRKEAKMQALLHVHIRKECCTSRYDY